MTSLFAFRAKPTISQKQSVSFREKWELLQGKPCLRLLQDRSFFIPPTNFIPFGPSKASLRLLFFHSKAPPLDFPRHIYQISDKLLTELKEIQQEVDEYFEKDRFIVVKPREGKELEATYVVKRLELFLWSTLCDQRKVEDSSVEQSLKNYILILSVMKNHLNENLSLADLAQLCSMSVSLIEKSIFKHENCGAMSFFNNLKMQSAAQKLNEGVSIKEAALSIGFPNQSYFSDRFKKWAGKSPSVYRKELK